MAQQTVQLWKHQAQFLESPWQFPDVFYHFLIGGYGCVHGDTLLDTPNGKIAIKDFKGGDIYSWDGNRVVVAEAEAPYILGEEDLYTFILENGKSITTTLFHQFMRPDGTWDVADNFAVGNFLVTIDGFARICGIKFHSRTQFWDVAVPETQCYFADGVLNHNCGKSFSIVMLIIKIAKLYWTQPCTGILSSSTISLLKKTVIADLIKVVEASKIPYKYNQSDNIFTLGAVKYYLIGSDEPGRVYGYSVSFAICDELDELPIDKCQDFVKAITERVRVPFPRGKKPFVCMPTTAQGLKGIFAVVTGFKEANIPYILIRGRTKDNLANSTNYVENLYRQYTEMEQKAFLEGEFVNLNEGRVYGEYDDLKHDVDRFELADDETVYVGQDINSGFSKAVAIVKRDCDLYVVKDFSFKSVGDIPRVLRQHFPTQRIVWVPDASAKEIMSGYAREVRQYKIEIKMAYVNPSITERIFIVNKLFRMGRLYLIRKDAKELSMALKIRQFDETGKPSKGRGSKAPDHVNDALDIVCHRIVGFDNDFKSIWELAQPMRGNKTGEATIRTREEDSIFTASEA